MHQNTHKVFTSLRDDPGHFGSKGLETCRLIGSNLVLNGFLFFLSNFWGPGSYVVYYLVYSVSFSGSKF